MNLPKYINWFVEESAVTLEDGAPISCFRFDYSADEDAYREWALHLRQHYETDDERKEIKVFEPPHLLLSHTIFRYLPFSGQHS